MMRLYHFTSQYHIDGIRREGICKGKILLRFEPPKFRSGYQWLTDDPAWDQGWANRSGLLPYSTTALRIAIDIPRREQQNALCWLEACHELAPRRICQILNEYGEPWRWYVFRGIVRPEWFAEIELNPTIVVNV